LEIVERQVAAAWARFDDALHHRQFSLCTVTGAGSSAANSFPGVSLIAA
jgi:hypothetical protein